MGVVWKAHDVHLDRVVAIKMLLRGALDDATTRERFRLEARVLSRLSHPGVATVFDFNAQDGDDFLVMEYVAGRHPRVAARGRARCRWTPCSSSARRSPMRSRTPIGTASFIGT